MDDVKLKYTWDVSDDGFIITEHEISDSDVATTTAFTEFTSNGRSKKVDLPECISRKTRVHMPREVYDDEQSCLVAVRQSFITSKSDSRKSIAACHDQIENLRQQAESHVQIELKTIQVKKDKINELKDRIALVSDFIED